MSSDKLYQIDIVYDFYEKLSKQRIESSELEVAIEETIKFLDEYKDDSAFIHQAFMFIAGEKVTIKQKVIELINRRKNGQ